MPDNDGSQQDPIARADEAQMDVLAPLARAQAARHEAIWLLLWSKQLRERIAVRRGQRLQDPDDYGVDVPERPQICGFCGGELPCQEHDGLDPYYV